MLLNNDDIQVGNIIANGKEFSNTSSIGKVLEIGNEEREFEQVYCECEESFQWFFKDNYCAVPLTDDWHDILGGVKNGFNQYVYDISRFGIEDETCFVFSGDYLYLREKVDDPGKPPYEFSVLWNKDLKKEFYVHEFQNLYKIISGKKLKFEFEMITTKKYNL